MINTFIHSRSSLKNHTRFQTKMDKVYTCFQTKNGAKRNPWGRHTAYIGYIREYNPHPPPPPPGNLSIREILVITTSTSVYTFSLQGSQCEMSTFLASVNCLSPVFNIHIIIVNCQPSKQDIHWPESQNRLVGSSANSWRSRAYGHMALP